MIGTTRSRVSDFMNKCRKLGLISYNGKIEVNNSLLNAILHEKPEIERDHSITKNQTNWATIKKTPRDERGKFVLTSLG